MRQAVAENGDRLYEIQKKMIKDLTDEGYAEKAEEITEERIKEIVTEFITACAEAYDDYLNGFWNDVRNVYPEVHFSYEEAVENPAVTMWMNGTADLILEMEGGKYRLIDYKSDNDFFLTEDEMNKALEDKYESQLAVYRGVIQTMLGVETENIETGIISFSQKDGKGNLLSGKQVRVRYTKLDGKK